MFHKGGAAIVLSFNWSFKKNPIVLIKLEAFRFTKKPTCSKLFDEAEQDNEMT